MRKSNDRYRVGRLFSDFTAALEIATGVAVEGQNPCLTLTKQKSVLRRLRRELNSADSIVARAGKQLGIQEGENR